MVMHDEKIVEAVGCAIFHAKPRNRIWDALPTEFKNQYRKQARAAVSAYLAAGWQDISTAPEDEWLLVATTGGWVGEAMVVDGEWKWATGNVFHSDIIPLKWMPLPEHPEISGRTLADANSKSPIQAREE
jgi:hypothetical protein